MAGVHVARFDGRQRLEFPVDADQFGDGGGGPEPKVLRQPADGSGDADRAGAGAQAARDQAEQGGLPGAVGADQSRVAGPEGRGDVVDGQRAVRLGEGEVVEDDGRVECWHEGPRDGRVRRRRPQRARLVSARWVRDGSSSSQHQSSHRDHRQVYAPDPAGRLSAWLSRSRRHAGWDTVDRVFARRSQVHLRREFENPGPALKTVASRLSRGAYERSERPSEPSVTDSRGRVVRSVGKTQTSLSAAEVDELVALYEQGMTLAQLGERFGVYHRTVAAHLVRRSVPMRVRGLAEEHTCEAVRLYEGGMTLMEVGLHFGVSQGAVKRAVAAAGATIRPRGRRVAVTE